MAFNNGPKLVTSGLSLVVDAADKTSYPGSGNSWRDLITGTVTGSITGSISYTSTYYGGLTFANTASAILFPSTVASFGTGSFTVELTFTPTTISGIHWLISKNSGSFPNWGIYLSGSNGSGKLFTEFRISSTLSSSISSSTTFTTGSNYLIDSTFAPYLSGSVTYINGLFDNSIRATTGGTLTNTGSLTVGNNNITSSGFIGTLYNCKIYNTTTAIGLNALQVASNYNTLNYRMALPKVSNYRTFEMLIVGAGGGGGRYYGGGGGAGGVVYNANVTVPITTTSIPIVIGAGGTYANGSDSYILTRLDLTAFGGGVGYGNSSPATTAANGGSGGGGNYYLSGVTVYNNTPGNGILGQGNSGGSGTESSYVSGFPSSGGGGGASQTGRDGTPTLGGGGGSGSYFPQFTVLSYGSPTGWFGGGGAGYASSQEFAQGSNSGGPGGGGGSNKGGSSGTTNTGGGGGGGGANGGGVGGSGIAIIRYLGTPIATGGIIVSSVGYTYHYFTSSGNFTFL
jgi:hypothetical protein